MLYWIWKILIGFPICNHHWAPPFEELNAISDNPDRPDYKVKVCSCIHCGTIKSFRVK